MRFVVVASQLTEAATGGSLDDDRLARRQHRLVAALQPLHTAVVTAHPVLAALAGLPALQAVGAHVAEARQDGAVHPLQEADAPQRAVAGAPFAPAARAAADAEFLQQHGVA